MDQNKLDFEGLSNFLLYRIREILPAWLPGGHLVGHEYSCADLRGGQGRSCKVNVNTGKWSDFAAGDKGGDLISLYAAIQGISQGDAAKALTEQYAFKPLQNAPAANVSRETSEPAGILPPDTVVMPDFKHPKLGEASKTWAYKNAEGRLMFFIARYETAEGKEFIPWTWSGSRWQCKAWPAPRPLYGLEILAQNPGKPVLIVEGEKAADAARSMDRIPYVVISWPGGSKAVSKVDWTPVYDRKVLIWPDADIPGVKAGTDIATLLKPHCPEVKKLAIDLVDAGTGWDAADAVKEGWGYEKFKEWAIPRATVFNLTINQTNNITVQQADTMEAAPPDESMYALWERLGIATSTSGHPICNEDNVMRVFEKEEHLGSRLWFDDFYNSVFINDKYTGPREMKDLDVYKLTTMLQRAYGFQRVSDAVVRRALVQVADRVHKNEPRDWMESLVWDKKPRLEMFFCTHLGAKQTPYVCAASKNFWISMVARIYSPGCIMRTMPILKSKQWAGKSTAFALIGGKWYAEALESIQSNNFLQSLHGKMLIEFADMSGMDRADVNRIKQIISCRMDRFRAPYDRVPNDHPRRCVLVSTTNEGNFLRDDTGGSRFWPIETGTIDHEAITRDRDQLFAEAVAYYKEGQDWYIMPIDETEAVQEKYRQEDEWEAVISEYLGSPNLFTKETTVAKVASDCLKIPMDRLDKSTQMRIARNLTVIGWEKLNKREGSKIVRVWVQKKVNTEEVSTYD